MRQFFKRFFFTNSGATSLEYAFIAALVSIAAITAFQLLGNNLNTKYTNIASEVAK